MSDNNKTEQSGDRAIARLKMIATRTREAGHLTELDADFAVGIAALVYGIDGQPVMRADIDQFGDDPPGFADWCEFLATKVEKAQKELNDV